MSNQNNIFYEKYAYTEDNCESSVLSEHPNAHIQPIVNDKKDEKVVFLDNAKHCNIYKQSHPIKPKIHTNDQKHNESQIDESSKNRQPNKILHNPRNKDIELSPEQKYAFEKFKNGENLFITGPGGTGKTMLIHYLTNWANTQHKKIQVCALTGCAAVLLGCNARTIHSWSGIKIARGDSNNIVKSVINNIKIVKIWRKTNILIVDEVSMMSKKIFDIIDEIARKTRNIQQPFGGMQIVFLGDFYQLPPVGTVGEPDTFDFCFSSYKWYETFPLKNHIVLKTIFRQTDPEYIRILDQVRRGELDDESCEILKSHVKREYIDVGFTPMKLFPVRSKVDYVNSAMFAKLNEPEIIFSIDTNKNCKTYIDSGKEIDLETIHICNALSDSQKDAEIEKLILNHKCSQNLALKKGANVMCTVNMIMDLGICNGSQGIITEIRNGVPYVDFTNGIIMPVEKHTWQSDEYPTITISQIPLCLSWAMTIHKIQGASLKMAEIDIGNTVFEFGQTYVALSRIQTLNGLYLSAFQPHRIKTNPIVKEFYSKINTNIDTIQHNNENELELIEIDSDNEVDENDIVDENIRIIKHVQLFG